MKYLENEFIPAIPDGIKYSNIDKNYCPFLLTLKDLAS